MHELALLDHARGWVQQFHLGALRNNSSRMLKTLGPDIGFDSIRDFEIARPLAKFLKRLDHDNRLAKTIVYNLNPRDNEVLATLIGNFQDGSVPGKMHFGSAGGSWTNSTGWKSRLTPFRRWACCRALDMLTDSRSFLSYSRHQYFRRLLCNILGKDVRRGLLRNDRELHGGMVTDICFRNARGYFGLNQ